METPMLLGRGKETRSQDELFYYEQYHDAKQEYPPVCYNTKARKDALQNIKSSSTS